MEDNKFNLGADVFGDTTSDVTSTVVEKDITSYSVESIPTKEEVKVEDTKKEDLIAKELDRENTEAGSKKTKLAYESTVLLPSKGILYKEDNIPANITLRGMTTKDEKIMYASQGADVFKKILRNCIVSPENIDINRLISADEMFLILQLRMVTFGDKYKVRSTCPHCGSVDEHEISLSDFDIMYLDDNFTEPINIELPASGDTLSLRLLRNSDTEYVEKYARRFAKQFNQNYKEVMYICRMAKYITAINGKPVDFVDARSYVENMVSLDSAKMQTVINSIIVGVDTIVDHECTSCGELYDFAMPITSEFFRPTIK